VIKKLKLSHYTSWRRLGERRYRSYSFFTSALHGGEWSASRPSRALPPRKGPPLPIVQEAGWAPEPVWTQRLEEKPFRLCRESNLYRLVVQPVARHYTDWAIQLTEINNTNNMTTNNILVKSSTEFTSRQAYTSKLHASEANQAQYLFVMIFIITSYMKKPYTT
jgi:hypothetical protein